MGRLLYGVDVIEGLRACADESANCCVTSPPYFGLRDYGTKGQIGLEKTPTEFVEKIVEVFREVRRVLRKDGTLWLNLGDSYVGATNQHKDGGSQGKNSCIAKKTMGGIPSTGRSDRNKALYAQGVKMKDLIGIPWMVAFALRSDGWYLRQDIIWHKPNPMPESVRDRCTKAHEYVFLLSKSQKYFFDVNAIKEPSIYQRPPAVPVGWDTGKGSPRKLVGRYRNAAPKGSFNGKTEAMAATGQNAFRAITEKRNKRSVWTVNTKPYKGAHFATFPTKLIEPMILAGCPLGGTVIDPFSGSGTTGEVAISLGRKYVGIDLNKGYEHLALQRIQKAKLERALL